MDLKDFGVKWVHLSDSWNLGQAGSWCNRITIPNTSTDLQDGWKEKESRTFAWLKCCWDLRAVQKTFGFVLFFWGLICRILETVVFLKPRTGRECVSFTVFYIVTVISRFLSFVWATLFFPANTHFHFICLPPPHLFYPSLLPFCGCCGQLRPS